MKTNNQEIKCPSGQHIRRDGKKPNCHCGSNWEKAIDRFIDYWGIKDRNLACALKDFIQDLLARTRKEEYQRGFIDGSHETGEQSNEIHTIELNEARTEGYEEGFWIGTHDLKNIEEITERVRKEEAEEWRKILEKEKGHNALREKMVIAEVRKDERKNVDQLIAEEMIIAQKEGQPTSRLTSLIMKIRKT